MANRDYEIIKLDSEISAETAQNIAAIIVKLGGKDFEIKEIRDNPKYFVDLVKSQNSKTNKEVQTFYEQMFDSIIVWHKLTPEFIELFKDDLKPTLLKQYQNYTPKESPTDWYGVVNKGLEKSLTKEHVDKFAYAHLFAMINSPNLTDEIRDYCLKLQRDIFRNTYKDLDDPILAEIENLNKKWLGLNCKTESLYDKFVSKVDWNVLPLKAFLSEHFISHFENQINWSTVSNFQFLSDDFIEHYRTRLNIDTLINNKNISSSIKKKLKVYKETGVWSGEIGEPGIIKPNENGDVIFLQNPCGEIPLGKLEESKTLGCKSWTGGERLKYDVEPFTTISLVGFDKIKLPEMKIKEILVFYDKKTIELIDQFILTFFPNDTYKNYEEKITALKEGCNERDWAFIASSNVLNEEFALIFKDKLESKFIILNDSKTGKPIVSRMMEKKMTFVDTAKSDMTKASYRVVSTQMVEGTKRAIITLLQNKGHDSDKLLIASQLLDSEFGTALISGVLGYALTYIPLPQVQGNKHAQIIAEEFRVNAMATAGNEMLGIAIEHFLPVITNAMTFLPKEETEKLRIATQETVPMENVETTKMEAAHG